MKKPFLFLGLLGLAVGGMGCPASPPSGPEEVPGPSAFTLPESVMINIDAISAAEESALVVGGGRFFIESSGEWSEEIMMGSDFAGMAGEIADHVLNRNGPLGILTADIGAEVTSFEATIPEEGEGCAGEVVRADFSPYSSGKAETEDCSGSTAGSPVCARIWVGDQNVLAIFMTDLPTTTAYGAGHFWTMGPPECALAEEERPPPEGLQMGITWDHTDMADRTTELFFQWDSSEEGISEEDCHARLHQSGADEGSATKTVHVRARFSRPGEGVSCELEYVGRWKEGEDFWSGKFSFDCGAFQQEDLDICASLSTGEEVDDSNCALIDITGEDFLDLAETEDFTFPE